MHNEDLINLSKARITHSMDCLKATEFLLSSEEYKGVVNRAYYVAFHAVRTMLVIENYLYTKWN